jgi:hypothetical protein
MVDGEVAMEVVVERRVLQVIHALRKPSRSRSLPTGGGGWKQDHRRQHPRKETELLTNPCPSPQSIDCWRRFCVA